MSSGSRRRNDKTEFARRGTRIAIVIRFSIVKTAIPASVQRFLRHDIGSPESLTILLLMRRHVRRWWAAHQLAEELGMPAEISQLQLERLSARNLLDVRIAESLIYRFRPDTERLAGLVDEVARAYEANQQAVHDLVSEGHRSYPTGPRRVE